MAELYQAYLVLGGALQTYVEGDTVSFPMHVYVGVAYLKGGANHG